MRTIKVFLADIDFEPNQKEKLKGYLDTSHTIYAPLFHIYYSFNSKDYINSIHGDISVIIVRDNREIEDKIDRFIITYYGLERLIGELEYLFDDVKKYIIGEGIKSAESKKILHKFSYNLHDAFNSITNVGNV